MSERVEYDTKLKRDRERERDAKVNSNREMFIPPEGQLIDI